MCYRRKINIIIKLNVLCVDSKNLFAALYIRFFNRNLAVKAARSQNSRVKNINAVGCGKNDKPLVVVKAVHFNKQLIQGLLTLIVRAEAVGTGFCKGINFINKDDTRSLVAGLAEKIADAGSTNADKHFNKVRAGNAEEWNSGLTCNCAGKKSFTGSRITYQ